MRLNSYLWQMTLRGLQNFRTTYFKSSYFVQSMKYYFNSYFKEQIICGGWGGMLHGQTKRKEEENELFSCSWIQSGSHCPCSGYYLWRIWCQVLSWTLANVVFIIPVHRWERQVLLDLSTSPWHYGLQSQITCTACTTMLVSCGGTSHHSHSGLKQEQLILSQS